jgi:S-adenosylmethionine:tRNA ribosyltransferase-isomerase
MSFEKIQAAKHVTAVGTTTCRALETVFKAQGSKLKTHGFTDIFIRPGYKFKRVNSLITNFHLPSTSLLMLVAAFIADKKGLDENEAAAELMRIYRHAIKQQYRFYSFGDALLIV